MDIQVKKALLKSIPSALYIVALASKDTVHFFVVSWVSQVSKTPPQLSIAIRKKSRAYSLLSDTTVMTLNFFSKDQQPFFKDFFKKGKNKDFIPSHTLGKNGVLIIDTAIAHFVLSSCVYPQTDGDHQIVIGTVSDASMLSSKTPQNFESLELKDTPWSYDG